MTSAPGTFATEPGVPTSNVAVLKPVTPAKISRCAASAPTIGYDRLTSALLLGPDRQLHQLLWRSHRQPSQHQRVDQTEHGGIGADAEGERQHHHDGEPRLDEAGRDVKYAARMFARQPGFTVVVVLTLTLGIGANTAVFSLIDALMLRWLPVRSPQELVQLSIGPTKARSEPVVSDRRRAGGAARDLRRCHRLQHGHVRRRDARLGCEGSGRARHRRLL